MNKALPEVWVSVSKLLEQNIPGHQYKAWIEPLEFISIEEVSGKLVARIAAGNDFTINWIKNRFHAVLEQSFSQVIGKPLSVTYEVIKENFVPSQNSQNNSFFSEEVAPSSYSPPLSNIKTQPGITLNSSASVSGSHSGRNAFSASSSPNYSNHSVPQSVIVQRPYSAIESGLDPKYVFESFVVGASNEFANASAIAVAEKPALQYNPLFIYSPPGLGKTHLLHAIGNHVLSKNPKARVIYLSAEVFANELIESIQHHRMPQFRAKYRDSYDLILMDDVQFIAGKVKTEEEFFHTFNSLYGSKRQIVLTSDRPPKDIQGLEERIRTRFEWGLVVDVHPPEIETRIAILRAKAEQGDIYLPDDVALFLATYIKSNVRELEGLLIRLQAQASLSGSEISLEMAKQELKTSIPEEGAHFTVESIQQAVSKHFHLKISELKANTRARQVALPRQIAMYLIRKYAGIGFKEIGMYFGGKDHTTVMHACSKIESSFKTDEKIKQEVESIQNML